MAVIELGHLVLYVHDLERSAAFYRDVLGWHQVVGPGGDLAAPGSFPVAVFTGGHTHHELLLIEIDSDDELRAALAAVLAAGGEVTGTADHAVTHSVYLRDPDGNEIELFIDVSGVDWRDPANLIGTPGPLRL
jgi:catechol-2,3-dioxygenase